jgi:hypothetical protein
MVWLAVMQTMKAILLCMCAMIFVVNGMNVYVKPNEEQCFMEEAKRSDKLITSFNVAAGGMLPIVQPHKASCLSVCLWLALDLLFHVVCVCI